MKALRQQLLKCIPMAGQAAMSLNSSIFSKQKQRNSWSIQIKAKVNKEYICFTLSRILTYLNESSAGNTFTPAARIFCEHSTKVSARNVNPLCHYVYLIGGMIYWTIHSCICTLHDSHRTSLNIALMALRAAASRPPISLHHCDWEIKNIQILNVTASEQTWV